MQFRTKVSLLYAGFLALIVVCFSAAIFGVFKPTIVASIDKSLDDISTTVLSNVLAVPVQRSDERKVEVLISSDEILRIPGVSVQIWQTNDGQAEIVPQLVATSRDLAGTETALDPLRINQREATYSDVSNSDSLDVMPLRVLTRPFKMDGDKQIGVVQVAASTMIVEDVTEGMLSVVILVAMIGVIVVIALGMLLSYTALRPIQRITAAAARISTSNDLTTRLPADLRNDEIGKLTRAFNHMMARLERLFGVQQGFIADLSHELRTPLTAIQGNVDLLKRFGTDPAALEAIEGETKRMTRMVNEVLLLARVDSGDIVVDLQPLDLDVLVLETFNHVFALPDAKNRHLHIKLDTEEIVRVRGDSARLQLLVQHLISNAIRFTPDGGVVTVSLYTRDDQYAIVEVQDSGIGIHDDDIGRIFDRFYQADDSRLHRSDDDGAGLGLSIVQWIADVHSGSIEVESESGEGSIFRLCLPLDKDA